MARLGRRRDGNGDARTIFFATDVHGSEVCFRKFVNAASFYGADLLVLGGDLTGKHVVPLVELPDGRVRAEVAGEERVVTAERVDALERQVRDLGSYPARMRDEEYAELASRPEAVDRLFARLMRETLVRWLALAREKLGGRGVRIVTAPGNDDPFEVDEVIREHGGETVLLAEGDVLEAAPGHELLSVGWSNPTPWHTHRELPEGELRARIDAVAARLERPETAVFNLHVPPYDSGLDTAPLLDEHLTVRTSFGAQLVGPVGSTAVREALEAWQPLVSLHGHVHESGGTTRIGRTLAINAGSEYAEGVLRGVLVTVGGGELLRYQATTG
ncbi:MAG: metallophosphoesterase family protein [Pseudomonadota bacterium]